MQVKTTVGPPGSLTTTDAVVLHDLLHDARREDISVRPAIGRDRKLKSRI